jgi:hypothetical protein
VGFEEDMALLTQKMKQLETEYEQWFSGALLTPPWQTQKIVDEIVKRYGRNPPQSLMERSVFMMHQAKYNSYSEMWARRTRLKEEGKLVTGKEERARVTRQPDRPTESGQDEFRKVFDRYVAAKEKAGESTGRLTYDSFRKKLSQQADKFRKSGKDVDFGVSIKDGKVSVVARRKK